MKKKKSVREGGLFSGGCSSIRPCKGVVQCLGPFSEGAVARTVRLGELNSLRQKSKIFATSLKEGGEGRIVYFYL